MSQYYEWNEFENVYFEDSFVLRIEETEKRLTFILEVVLTDKHSFYIQPKVGEQYCYRGGKVVFSEIKSLKWLTKNTRPFTDADDSEDYGNIDSFELTEEGYHLIGDWGELVVNSSDLVLEWLE